MDMKSFEAKNEDVAKENQSRRKFGCKYCDKKFSTCQALGGHQNAHKLERALSKNKGEKMGNTIPGYGYQLTHHHHLYPYPKFGTFPTQTYSGMIRQSRYTTPHFGSGQAYHMWPRPDPKEYEAGKNLSFAWGFTNTGDSSSSSSSRPLNGDSSLLGRADHHMSKLNDSLKENGNSEVDLTLRL